MSFHYIHIFNLFSPTSFICILFGDDVFLESACLVSWPVRKQTHRPKEAFILIRSAGSTSLLSRCAVNSVAERKEAEASHFWDHT